VGKGVYKEIGCENMEWIQLAQRGIRQLGLVKVEYDEICTSLGEEGLMYFTAPFLCTGSTFQDMYLQKSSTKENYPSVLYFIYFGCVEDGTKYFKLILQYLA
jgi:hypothetical protein